jgi:hypothetical protein
MVTVLEMGRYTVPELLFAPEFHTSTYQCMSGYGLDDRAIGVRSTAEAKRIFPVTYVSPPALGPTQPPVQWVPWVLSPGVKRGRGVTQITHPIYTEVLNE